MENISFRTTVLPLSDRLFRLALRITMNRAEAEDVVQDTLLKVWEQRNEWEQIDSLEAFALTICRNRALDVKKRAGRNNTSLDKIDSVQPYSVIFALDLIVQFEAKVYECFFDFFVCYCHLFTSL